MFAQSEKRTESDPLVDLSIQTARPEEKTQEFPSRVPDKTHDLSGSQRFSLLTGIRLYSPAQEFTSPGRKTIAARCIPDEANGSKQGVFLCSKYRRMGYRRIDLELGYCSLLNRLLDWESSCEITSSSAVCCVSDNES